MEGELWPVIDVRPLTGSIGAEIFGVDLSNNLDTSTVARLRQELLTHLVIFFRDQSLDAEQQKNFARQFGELYVHPYLVVGDDPTVIEIKRKSGDKRVTGDHWHSDATIDSEPPLGSILYGIKIPPYGGDTLFSNQYLAYESLSEIMQRRLDGLMAIHSDRQIVVPNAMTAYNQARSTTIKQPSEHREMRNIHPLVRTHPETGRKALYVNRAQTIGMRRHARRREPTTAQFSIRARQPARVRLQVPVGPGLRRILGQSLYETLCRQRHGPIRTTYAPGPDLRR